MGFGCNFLLTKKDTFRQNNFSSTFYYPIWKLGGQIRRRVPKARKESSFQCREEESALGKTYCRNHLLSIEKRGAFIYEEEFL